MKRLISLVMALALTLQLSAQMTVVIGDSTSTEMQKHSPAEFYYTHSYSQTIYTASELGFAGEISAIGYYHDGENYQNGTVKIYAKEVTESETTSFLPTEGFVLVYSGVMPLTQGCVMLNLSQPFVYSGSGNLAIIFIREGTSYQNNHNFISTSGVSLYACNDDDPYSISNPTGWPSQTVRPVTKFEYTIPEGYCYPPTELTASNITTNSAVISWTGHESSTNFGVAYKKTSETDWTIATENTIDTYLTLTNLDSYTEYQFKVWSICPEDNSIEKTFTFVTLPTADNFIGVPSVETFDDIESISTWIVEDAGAASKWCIGNAVNNTRDENDVITEEGGALYISNDNGETNAWSDISSAFTTHVYTLINIEEGNYYSMSFDHRLNVSSTYTQISLVPLNYDFTNALPNNEYKIDTVKYSGSDWRNVSVVFPQDITPGAYKLVFSWYKGSYGTGELPAAIDNVNITSTSCATASDISTNFTDEGNSITMYITVNDILNDNAEYLFEYKLGNETEWNSIQGASPISIEDLPYNTKLTYRVTAMCFGNEPAIPSDEFVTFTPCGVISEFPWTADLSDWIAPAEGSSNTFRNAPVCWFNLNGGGTGFYFTNNTQSNTILKYYGAYGTSTTQFSDWMILPAFEFTAGERITFNYFLNDSYYPEVPKPHIDIFACNIEESDFVYPSDTSRFVLVNTIYNPDLTTEPSIAEVSLAELSGTYRLAFAIRECSQSFHIADISISEIPSCPDIYGFSASLADVDAVNISYSTNNITEEGVIVAYSEAEEGVAFDPTAATTITIPADAELPFVVDGLEEGITYNFAVQQACDGAWSETITITTPIVYPVPFSATFDNEESTPVVIIESDNTTNNWFIGTAENNTTGVENGGALYVSNNNGTTAGYTNNVETVATASIALSFEEGAEFDISFDYKVGGESGPWDYLSVYLVPFGEELSDEYLLSDKLRSTSNQWRADTITKSALRGNFNLIFLWINDYSAGVVPGAIVDNVKVESRACTGGIGTEFSFEEGADGNLLVVDIEDNVNDSPTYTIRYKKQSASEYNEIPGLTAADFPYEIDDNITFNTTYNIQVVVICGGENMPAETHNYTTPCGREILPWSEDFTEDPLITACWEQKGLLLPANGLVDYEDLNEAYIWGRGTRTFNGEVVQAAKANVYGANVQHWLITPIVDMNDANIYQISFDIALTDYNNTNPPVQPSPDDKLIVFASTDGGATWDLENALVFADGDEDTEHNFSSFSNTFQRYSFKLVDSENNPLSGNVRFAFYVESTINNADNDLWIDNIVVDQWSVCPTPYNLEVNNSSITSSSATFSFASMQAENWEYVILEGENADPETGTPIAIFTTQNIEISDLSSSTLYTLAVRSVCGTDVTSNWVTTTFTTLPSAVAVPYQTSFEDENDALGWISTSNTSNTWVIGTETAAEEDETSAYISNNGTSYAASSSYISTVAHIWKEFSFGETAENFELTFDWKVRGNTSSSSFDGGISVHLVDATTLPGDNVLTNPIAQLSGSDDWQNARIYLGNVTGNKRLVFTAIGYRTNDELSVPAAIDNINLSVASCVPIQANSVAVSSITSSSATVSWIDTDETHTSWNVYYKKETESAYTSVIATSASIELTELDDATTYYVYVTTDCGEEESIASDTITFLTECNPVSAFPYHEGFENSIALCWSTEIISGTANWVMEDEYAGGDFALPAEGEQFIQYKVGTDGPSARLISPVFDLTTLTTPYLKYDYFMKSWSGDLDEFKVQYRTSETAEWTDLVHHTTSVSAWTNDSLALPNPSATYQISILAISHYGYGVAIDNLFVYDPNATIEIVAPVVTTLAATEITHESATLNGTITAGSETITAQGFMYKASTAADWTTVNATGETMTATLTALTAETEYTFKAFATTATGTVEGETMTFTTTAASIVVTPPTVATLVATEITHESAILNGTITAGSEEITAQGFMYKASTAADWTTVNATGTTITATLTALTAETEYTFKAFATTATGTVEGEAMTFTTTAAPIVVTPPTVATFAATEITHESATLNGTITAGSETITAQGFMYKATAAADWTTVNATGTTITATLTALTAETEYTFKAFATTATGTVEGEAMTFTTTAAPIVVTPPTVVTLAATEITNATATLNGTITAGSEEITAQGFMYKASNVTDWATVDATGETMTATVEGLEAELEYVFKAFATTASGTVEGEELTFTTLSGLSDVNSVSIIASVYPNPADDKATISVSNVANGTKIVVSDMQGRIILSDDMSESTYELNTSNYASGVYYIRIISGNAVNTQKLIVK